MPAISAGFKLRQLVKRLDLQRANGLVILDAQRHLAQFQRPLPLFFCLRSFNQLRNLENPAKRRNKLSRTLGK